MTQATCGDRRWSAKGPNGGTHGAGGVLTGCGPVASEPPGTDVCGTYTGHSARASAPNADAAQDTIEGDTAKPSDPWESIRPIQGGGGQMRKEDAMRSGGEDGIR